MTGFHARTARFSGLVTRLKGIASSVSFARAAVIACGTLAMVFVFSASVTPARYDLSVGMVPSVTIVANKDVVDEITTAHNRELAAAAVTPSYRFQEGVTERVLENLSRIQGELSGVRQYALGLPEYSTGRKYSQAELDHARALVSLLSLRDYQFVTLMNAPQEQYDDMLTSLNAAVRNTMQGNVTQGQETLAINGILQIVGFRTNVSLLQNVALPILQKTIEANMVIDRSATDAARQAARDAVEPVVYKQGQNIVVRGEGRIRENQYKMLDSLGLLSRNEIDYLIYLGSFALVALVMSAMTMAVAGLCPEIHLGVRKLLVLHLVLLSVAAFSLLAKAAQLPYLAPLALAPMLLSILLGCLPAVIGNAAISVIAAFMVGGNSVSHSFDLISILVASLLSGTVAAMMLRKNQQRPLILLTGLIVSGLSFLAGLGIGLISNSDVRYVWERIRWTPAGGIASTLLCLALQPAFESVFNLCTPPRLLELGNPNRPLLKRLLMEAPGTYHHSIIIANLAEASAEAIHANALLARTAAYYHDIGKLKRPLYFKENQIGAGNIHDRTDPQVSAAIITAHVRDGVSFARQYRLPREIQQIIEQHHGDSMVSYFYMKAVTETEGSEVDRSEFRYEGTPPQTAEGAIIMICDTIEAAVRTLSAPSTEEIRSFIGQLIDRKIEEGQLRNAPLTLSDLSLIQKACSTVIYGVFHERIEYPDSSRDFLMKRHRFPGEPGSRPTAPQVPAKTDKAARQAGPKPPSPAKDLKFVHPGEFGGKGTIRVIEPPRTHKPVTVDDMIEPEEAAGDPAAQKPGLERNGTGG